MKTQLLFITSLKACILIAAVGIFNKETSTNIFPLLVPFKIVSSTEEVSISIFDIISSNSLENYLLFI